MKIIKLIFCNFLIFLSFCIVFNAKNADFSKKADTYYINEFSSFDDINAKSMCLIESSTGRVLYSKEQDKRLPMASTTKILTAILAIENTEDLDKKVLVPSAAVGTEGSSMYLKYGEEYSVRELLYGLMLPSGNDAANALAIIVFGSYDSYREHAKNLIDKLGLLNTNIVTASGLHDDNHYTSAYDLAQISRYAMQNDTFRDIVKTQSITLPKTDTNTEKYLRNKNKIMYNYSLVNGIKTGFTPEAGRCLVASACDGKIEFICVLLNAPQMEDLGKSLLERAFGEYKMKEVIKGYDHIISVPVQNSKTKEISLHNKNSFSYPLSIEDEFNIKIIYDYPVTMSAPVNVGEEIGSIKVYLKNDLIFEDKIYTINGAECNDYKHAIEKVLQKF